MSKRRYFDEQQIVKVLEMRLLEDDYDFQF